MINPEMHDINRVIFEELRRKGRVKISLVLENRAKTVTFAKIPIKKNLLSILDILTCSGGVRIGIRQK